jgi:predicted HTH domain antitoxin
MTNQTRTLTVELPSFVKDEDAKFMIYASLLGKGVLSSGKAAELLNITRPDFLLGVGQYGINIFSDDEESLEIAQDIEL